MFNKDIHYSFSKERGITNRKEHGGILGLEPVIQNGIQAPELSAQKED